MFTVAQHGLSMAESLCTSLEREIIDPTMTVCSHAGARLAVVD